MCVMSKKPLIFKSKCLKCGAILKCENRSDAICMPNLVCKKCGGEMRLIKPNLFDEILARGDCKFFNQHFTLKQLYKTGLKTIKI